MAVGPTGLYLCPERRCAGRAQVGRAGGPPKYNHKRCWVVWAVRYHGELIGAGTLNIVTSKITSSQETFRLDYYHPRGGMQLPGRKRRGGSKQLQHPKQLNGEGARAASCPLALRSFDTRFWEVVQLARGSPVSEDRLFMHMTWLAGTRRTRVSVWVKSRTTGYTRTVQRYCPLYAYQHTARRNLAELAVGLSIIFKFLTSILDAARARLRRQVALAGLSGSRPVARRSCQAHRAAAVLHALAPEGASACTYVACRAWQCRSFGVSHTCHD